MGREARAVGDIQLELLSGAQVERSVADHRERWLEMLYDPALRWQPGTLVRPAPRRRGPLRRIWMRADLAGRAEVWRGRFRASA